MMSALEGMNSTERKSRTVMANEKTRIVQARWKSLRAGLGAIATIAGCWFAHDGALAATFNDDVAFLKAHTDVIILTDRAAKAIVALAPAMQGRVMTSSAQGGGGESFGWINRPLIASHQLQEHMNVFGGEDRFWMGPEGGQFSIFFEKGAPFDLAHWFTPAPLDTQPFQVVQQNDTRAEFKSGFTLTNYSGSHFNVTVNRAVELLPAARAWSLLGVPVPAGVELVAFESINQLVNTGQRAWSKKTGLLSIWILGMFQPSPSTTIVMPFKADSDAHAGPPINANYFGPIPPERLVIKDQAAFFSGDGKFRSKIGMSPSRCRGVLGSYNSAEKVLTLVQFTFRNGESNYVNSMWEIQSHPYAGDVANSYNDGPAKPGAKPLGPFYEMESSSPAAELAPGQSIEHIHRTFHLTGPEEQLNPIAESVLGVSLRTITTSLPANPKSGG